jgi:hypothetical protein
MKISCWPFEFNASESTGAARMTGHSVSEPEPACDHYGIIMPHNTSMTPK